MITERASLNSPYDQPEWSVADNNDSDSESDSDSDSDDWSKTVSKDECDVTFDSTGTYTVEAKCGADDDWKTIKVIVIQARLVEIRPKPFTPCSLIHKYMTIQYDAIDSSGKHTAKLKIFTSDNHQCPIHEVTVSRGKNQVYQWDGNPNASHYRTEVDPYKDAYVEQELSPLLVRISLVASPAQSQDEEEAPIRTFSKFIIEKHSALSDDYEMGCADWAYYLWSNYCDQNDEAKPIEAPDPLTWDANEIGTPDAPTDQWEHQHYIDEGVVANRDNYHVGGNISSSDLPGEMHSIPDRDKDNEPPWDDDGNIDFGDLRPGDVISGLS